MQSILEFLLSLDRVRLTDWDKVRFHWDLPNYPWPVAMLIVLAAIGLAIFGFWSYQRQSASPAKRIVMGVCRALVLVFVLFLFMRPSLVLDQELKTPSVVAVWIDESASMRLADPYRDPQMKDLVQRVSKQAKLEPGEVRANRYHLAIDALINAKENWLHKAAEKQHVALFSGGPTANLVGVAQSPEDIDRLLEKLKDRKPDQTATDVPVVIADVFRQLAGQPVSAVVLLSDGRSTEGSLPTVATTLAQQHRTPVYAIPIGQDDEPLNASIRAVEAPESAFVKDPVAIKARLHVAGLTGPTQVRVRLMRIGGPGATDPKAEAELMTQEITVDPAKPDPQVELILKPVKAGEDKNERFDMAIRVDAVGDELTLADNKSSVVSTTVMDARVNVLYIDGYPRWEYRYLKNELIREKSINVSTLLLSADEDFAQEGDPEEKDAQGNVTFPGPIRRFPNTAEDLRKYDVILIGDVEPTFFSPSEMKLIADFVRKDGGGVGFIAGWAYNPNGYKDTALEPLLPIIPDSPALGSGRVPNGPPNVPNEPFNLVMTAAGRESNLFRFFEDSQKNVQQMADNPPMYWYMPVVGLQGSAEVLAVHPSASMGGVPAPLIVTGRYGAGRTLYSAVADTWRWRRYLGEPLYQSYWLQVCRLLYREKAMGQSRRVELLADAPAVEVGKPLRVTARIKDATLVAAAPQQLTVQVVDADGNNLEPMTLSRVGSSQETYQGVSTASQTGKITLALQPGLLPADVAPIEVNVKGPERENADVTVDLASLGVMADRTEGQIVRMQATGDLARLIVDKSQLNLVPISEELWTKPIALALVVILLAIEWFTRKSSGLI